ncbi:MAG: TonB family protein [Planctomycetota bacterium]|nr:TonB family protein [Planctomycetota bacterium]
MTRRDPTFLVILCVALVAHLAVLRVGVAIARRDLGWWQAAPGLAPPKTPADLVAPKPAPPPADDVIGEKTDLGKSINSAPGDQPMQSEVAEADQEQAMMSRDPVGLGGTASGKAVPRGLSGENGDGHPRAPDRQQSTAKVFSNAEAALASPPAPRSSAPQPLQILAKKPTNAAAQVAAGKATVLASAAKPVQSNAVDVMSAGPLAIIPPPSQAGKEPRDSREASVPPAQLEKKETQQPSAQPQPKLSEQQPADASQSGTGEKTGSADEVAGKPMPSGEFESVPVSSFAARFVGGKIEAREGRKLLTRRLPDLGPAAWVDVETLNGPIVVLQINIDESGNVTDVKTIHSSGSDNVDLACERAAQTWWFEPKKNPRTGKIGPEIIVFTLLFR